MIREAASISKKHDLTDKMDAPTENEAFITIKDHKDTFPRKIYCRLINPAKNHIGAISKHFLDRINNNLRRISGSDQWQNTSNVIEWFQNITNKTKMSFFKFDIVSFYPSISENLLMNALKWGSNKTKISSDEINTILHCRRSFLFYNQEPCVKKRTVTST